MSITNQNKPSNSQNTYYLSIGDGFRLIIGGAYRLVITAATGNLFVNQAKATTFETWATIQTTWASEIRTWSETATLIENTNRLGSTITNVNKP